MAVRCNQKSQLKVSHGTANMCRRTVCNTSDFKLLVCTAIVAKRNCELNVNGLMFPVKSK